MDIVCVIDSIDMTVRVRRWKRVRMQRGGRIVDQGMWDMLN